MRDDVRLLISAAAILVIAADTVAANRHVPGTYPTIQAAVDASNNWDTIVIAAGTYAPGEVDLGIMHLSIRGATVDGAPATILDGEGSNRLFSIDDGSDGQVIENIHFVNGWGGKGAAVRVYGPGGIEFNNCIFESNTATGKGGAIYAEGDDSVDGQLRLTNCAFVDNTGFIGGAVYACTTYWPTGWADVTVTDSTFDGNTASTDGGALYLYRKVEGLINQSTFTGNSANGSNGGGIATGSLAVLEVSQSEFHGNEALEKGGAIYVADTDGEWISIVESSFVSNQAGSNGGALREDAGRFDIDDSAFCGNEPNNFGGSNTSQSGVCSVNNCDDADGDYWVDACEDCDLDPDKIEPGDCGCGVADVDSDGDGTLDCFDNCPEDPNKTEPGACGCGVSDDDSDGDGTLDCFDSCPDDPDKTEPGHCGCGVADDGNDDGWYDCNTTDNGDGTATWQVDVGMSLSTAMSLASAGDTIALAEGMHVTSTTLNPNGLDITMIGAVDSAGLPASTIDAGFTHRVLTIDSGESASMRCENIIFTGGRWESQVGGGVLISGASPTFVNCWIHDNRTNQSGGGVCVQSGAAPTFTDCQITDNWCGSGGGLYVTDAAATLTGCVVSGNETTGNGGGVLVVNGSAEFINCEISSNTTGGPGGGMRVVTGATVVLDDTLMQSNDAAHYGGAIHLGSADCVVNAMDAMLCGNTPDNLYGADVWVDLGGSCLAETCDDTDGDSVLDDCDVCPGEDDLLDTDGDSVVDCLDVCPDEDDLNDSDADGTPDCLDGCPNDPDKIDAGVCGCGIADDDSDGDGTPDCLDGCPDDPDKTEPGVCGCGIADDDSDGDGTLDCLDGCPDDPDKIAPGVCGCGVADDANGNGWPDCDEQDNGNGTSTFIVDVGDEISTAVDAAETGDTVLLAAGVHTDVAVSLQGKAITLAGSVDTDGSQLSTIDAGGGGRVLRFESGETGASVVRDLILTGGTASNGGGVLISGGATPTIINCLIAGNSAPSGRGGGLYANASSPTLQGCVIASNSAKWGGGVCVSDAASSVLMEHCDVVDNEAGLSGGGVAAQTGSVSLAECTLTGNVASNLGGGVNIASGGAAVLSDCLIDGNTAGTNGGGINVQTSNDVVTIDACTISSNSAVVGGGVSNTSGEGSIAISDSLICENVEDNVYGQWDDLGGNCESDTCSTGDSDGDGVLDVCDVCPGGDDALDSDGDGTPDACDGCPDDANETEPGDCGCGVAEDDSDADGTPDCVDGCPDDPYKIDPGDCGCGAADTDSDADGTPDCLDGCPDDPNKIEAGVCGCGVVDDLGDSDGDSVLNCLDRCPGQDDLLDTDGDTVADCLDLCPGQDDLLDTDGDTVADCLDVCPGEDDLLDHDADGTPDCVDGCPGDPNKTEPGLCGCGVADEDADGTGWPDCFEEYQSGTGTFVRYLLPGTELSSAIAVSQTGDTVVLLAGTHVGAGVSLDGKDITLKGEVSDQGDLLTTLQGDGMVSVLRVESGETDAARIEQLIITGGSTFEDGGGIVIQNDSAVTVVNCEIVANSAPAGSGGGIAVTSGSAAKMYGCTIAENTAWTYGGGVSGFHCDRVWLEDCTLQGNAVSGDGGALHVFGEGSMAGLIGCQVLENIAGDRGGGLCVAEAGWMFVDHCVLTANSGKRGGGASAAGASAHLYVSGSTVSENHSDWSGGGIAVEDGDLTLEVCTVAGNVAVDDGGGLDLSTDGFAHVFFSVLSDNMAGEQGGGVSLQHASSMVMVDNSLVSANGAGEGGGLANIGDAALVDVYDTNICENTPTNLLGGWNLWGDTCESDACDDVDGDGTLNQCDVDCDAEQSGGPDCDGNGLDDACDPDQDGDGVPDGCDDDIDGDDIENACDADYTGGTDCDSNGVDDACDVDQDGDGTPDVCDGCPDDPNKTDPGACGCGIADTDTDLDGTADCLDNCPDDPNKAEPGVCGCGVVDDANGDGWYDCDLQDNGDGTSPWSVDIDTSLALALSLATSGDVIALAQGTHSAANLNPQGVDVVMIGAVDADGLPASTIDAGQAHRVLTVESGETSLLRFESIIFASGMAASENGGGVRIDGASPIFNNCWITNCQTSVSGGGVYVGGGGSPTFSDCRFVGNVAGWGGGLFIKEASASFTRCTITENTSTGNSGGVSVVASDAVFTDCDVYANETSGTGGGLRPNTGGAIVLVSTSIHDNTAGSSGGGIYVGSGDCTVEASGTSLCANVPDNVAGGSWTDLGGSCDAAMCDDTDADGVLDGCDVCPGEDDGGDADGDGVVDCLDGCPDDPNKTDPEACGCGVAETDTDVDGTPDCVDGCPDDPNKTDPGACGCGVLDDADGDGWPDCQQQDNGDGTQTHRVEVGDSIATAIGVAVDGDIVQLAAGVHGEGGLNLGGKAITVAGEVDLDGTLLTTIDASGAERVLLLTAGEPAETIVRDLVLDGGWAGSSGGGGVLISGGGSPSLVNCHITGCLAADGRGGGVYVSGASPTIVDCTIEDNEAKWGGGLAIQSEGSAVTMTNCVLRDNAVSKNGGGVFVASNAGITMEGCNVEANAAGKHGGGVHIGLGSTASISGCALESNTATNNGGGLNVQDSGSYASVDGCIIRFNSASAGGGVSNTSDQAVDISESTICSNAPTNLYGAWVNVGGNCDLDTCDENDLDGDGSPDACDDDIDGDGYANDVDWAPYDASEWNDHDGDGTGDNADPDDDNDGIDDVIDNCPWDANELQADCDEDGVGDVCELLDGTQVDEDGNGVPDDCQTEPCSPDMDGTGVVDIEDLLLFMAAWGTEDADLNGDGTPDINDLLVLMGMWGACP